MQSMWNLDVGNAEIDVPKKFVKKLPVISLRGIDVVVFNKNESLMWVAVRLVNCLPDLRLYIQICIQSVTWDWGK